MNADSFRHLYNYHFSENHKIWEYVTRLSYVQFVQAVNYSHGSVRNQVVHLLSVDEAWFGELRGIEPPEPYQPASFDDREVLCERWKNVEQDMFDYLAQLQDDMLWKRPIKEPEEDRNLMVWQVLIHVINHGTDHRAQILRLLHDLGIQTTSQDYIFYAYDHL